MMTKTAESWSQRPMYLKTRPRMKKNNDKLKQSVNYSEKRRIAAKLGIQIVDDVNKKEKTEPHEEKASKTLSSINKDLNAAIKANQLHIQKTDNYSVTKSNDANNST